jgi:hypothetical protein
LINRGIVSVSGIIGSAELGKIISQQNRTTGQKYEWKRGYTKYVRTTIYNSN